jgi:hypothetical protein
VYQDTASNNTMNFYMTIYIYMTNNKLTFKDLLGSFVGGLVAIHTQCPSVSLGSKNLDWIVYF